VVARDWPWRRFVCANAQLLGETTRICGLAQPVHRAGSMRDSAFAQDRHSRVRLVGSSFSEGAVAGEPCPHPDAALLEQWLHVVACIVEHGALLEQQGADSARVASTREVIEHAWRGAQSNELRRRALERMRILARSEGGLVQTALDVAESLAFLDAA
jgi:hypothetical protein